MKIIAGIKLIPNNPLEALMEYNGYYKCPKGFDGERLGPLVGYAGKYSVEDGTQRQYVGDIYANFAKAEEYPFLLYHYAEQVRRKIAPVLSKIDVFCGVPLGGYSFAEMLGLVFDRRVIKAEKKTVALATEKKREQSVLIFGRHQPKSGDRVAIVEDVCNNFSTTDQLIKIIEQAGGEVTAIVCLLNRSPNVDDIYTTYSSQHYNQLLSLPVISLVRMIIQEYKQNDPEVAEDIANGNVVWKPKDEWPRLMAAMELAR